MKKFILFFFFVFFVQYAEGQVDSYSCVTKKHKIEGTKTQIGTAWVTAAHVAEKCVSSIYEEHDLAVLNQGIPTDCENGIIDENVFLIGYPTSEGEVQRGVIFALDHPIDNQKRTVVMAKGVTDGYSGGPAVSVDTNKVVGIILSVGPKVQGDYRPVVLLPVSTICKVLNEN